MFILLITNRIYVSRNTKTSEKFILDNGKAYIAILETPEVNKKPISELYSNNMLLS